MQIKRVLLCILLVLAAGQMAYSAADTETGDKAALPVLLYGKQADGTVTAVFVDSSGISQIKTE